MGYKTRSRRQAEPFSASKRSTRSTLKRSLSSKEHGTIPSTSVRDAHSNVGKNHFVVEQDGCEHHQVWLENQDGPQDLGNQISDLAGAESSPNGYIAYHMAVDGVSHGIKSAASHIQGIQANEGREHYELPVNNCERRHIRSGSSEEGALYMDIGQLVDHSHASTYASQKEPRPSQGPSPAQKAREYFTSFFSKGPKKASGVDSTYGAKSTQLSTPVRVLNTTAFQGDDCQTTVHHLQESETISSTNTDSRYAHSEVRSDSATRMLTEKSQIDRQMAQDAIRLLDNDVVLLQKLLQEKENALRSAEARTTELTKVTIRTETLTREVHDLQITIHDLRFTLQAKEEALRESQVQYDRHRKLERDQQKRVEQEVAKLNDGLKDKKAVQERLRMTQRDLERASVERTNLVSQIKDLQENLRSREADLESIRTTIKSLEERHSEQTKRALTAAKELSNMKKCLDERELELRNCHRRINIMEADQDKAGSLELELQDLRGQLVKSEADIKGLEEANNGMVKDKMRAEKLVVQVRHFQGDIKKLERQLREAQASSKDLAAQRLRAADLEKELKSLRDLVDVQENHLTFLEDALQAHENCAVESQELEARVSDLQGQLAQKEGKIRDLQNASKGLVQKDTYIKTLQSEIQRITDELRLKDKGTAKMRKKSENDLAKVSSTAESLRSEIKGLRRELQAKSSDLIEAESRIKGLDLDKQVAATLKVEIARLKETIAAKDKRITDLDNTLETMERRADRTVDLKIEIKSLRQRATDAEQAASRSTKDLEAVSSTASTLVIQVDSLRQELSQKEEELQRANVNIKQLGQKSGQVEGLLNKISELQARSQSHEQDAHRADKKVKSLQAVVSQMESSLEELQQQLTDKEHSLRSTLEQATSDHDSTRNRLVESQTTIAALTRQLEEMEKKARCQVEAEQDQIKTLRQRLQEWEDQEEAWINKTSDLTIELTRSTDTLRSKSREIHDLELKTDEQNLELGRLNEALNTARERLRLDRKRRVSEIEAKVAGRTQSLLDDNAVLNKTVSSLQDEVVRMEKRIRLDKGHEEREVRLREMIRELTFWKETAMEQTKEWEITVANLTETKEQQVSELIRYKRQIHSFQQTINEADAWRLKATSQLEILKAMIAKLESELSMLKGMLGNHDAKDAKMVQKIDTLVVQIAELEARRDELTHGMRAKDIQIANLEDRLRTDINRYKTRLADTRRDLVAKDENIESLKASIAEHNRRNLELEHRVNHDKVALSALERMVGELRGTLAAQVEKYRILDKKHQTTMVSQADQSRQISSLEKRVKKRAEDADKQRQTMQLEIHNITRSYHDALAQLKDADIKLAAMVPAQDANHDACAARVQAGEKEVFRLSSRIQELEALTVQMTNDKSARDMEWARTESKHNDRIELMTKNHKILKNQLRDAEKAHAQERLEREQDRLSAEHEKQVQGEAMQTLQSKCIEIQKDYLLLETRMSQEMSTSKDLAELLATLRQSIKHDSEVELRSLDELEKSIKTHETMVQETLQFTRRRMDSGAFLESVDVECVTAQ
ncbi:hypothetical protein EDD11_008671 [Mortierella claussenii]|nr:hypothetical protein EDD11_008671 [Mortierella claussenii]